MSCPQNPCDNATCPGLVEAECVVDLGDCSVTWFIGDKDVTDLCQGQFYDTSGEKRFEKQGMKYNSYPHYKLISTT